MIDWEAFRIAEGILPSVFSATADELSAHGWQDYPRRRIPDDWRTRRPLVQRKGGRVREYANQREYRAANKDKINARRAEWKAQRRLSVIPQVIALSKETWHREKVRLAALDDRSKALGAAHSPLPCDPQNSGGISLGQKNV